MSYSYCTSKKSRAFYYKVKLDKTSWTYRYNPITHSSPCLKIESVQTLIYYGNIVQVTAH